MVKRNTPKKQKRKPSTSGGTPQGGDRMKIRCTKVGQKLTENEQPIPDLEPDGFPGTNPTRPTQGNQYDALSDSEDDVEMEEAYNMTTADAPLDLEPDGGNNINRQLTLFTSPASKDNSQPDDLEDDDQPFQLVESRPTRSAAARPVVERQLVTTTKTKKPKKTPKPKEPNSDIARQLTIFTPPSLEGDG